MKTILVALFWIAVCFIIASKTEINFKLFSLSFPKYLTGAWCILIALGVAFILQDFKDEYYQKGADDVIKMIKDRTNYNSKDKVE